uniref:Uncharacterized protein n=1 Tax=Anopheles atroparvus TaxID=41427 RepID=A0AAG5DA20_ANOAO
MKNNAMTPGMNESGAAKETTRKCKWIAAYSFCRLTPARFLGSTQPDSVMDRHETTGKKKASYEPGQL